jgi:hypothetical protein
MKLFSMQFLNYASERALKTWAQSALAFLGTGTVGLFEINWVNLLSVSLGATFLSVLTSIITQRNPKENNA